MKKLLPLALLPLLLFACKKDKEDDTTPAPQNKVLAMPLAVGNYWVYQKFDIDSDGVETVNVLQDSVYVSGKEVAHGDTFFVLKGGTSLTIRDNTLLRDSIGYLVDQHGHIYYAQNNYTDTLAIALNENVGLNNRYEFMAYKDSIYTVPAGTYTHTGTMLIRWIFLNPSYSWQAQRDASYTFAKDIGLIKRRIFYAFYPEYMEARLVRYHVN